MSNDVGLIGLAVMGRNLVLNLERNGFKVAVHNRTPSVTDEFLVQEAKGKKIQGFHDLAGFVNSLASPRKVIIMVKAGKPVDEMIQALKPLLKSGDIIIDAGNSLFQDTERRSEALTAAGLLYIGMGVSGGEEGALWGPSIMPGGESQSVSLILPMLEKIAAKADSGPCVTYIGKGGAGHFVKMVHNGIEYGDMQLIAEAYDVMRKGLAMQAPEIGAVFRKWNEGQLQSYLIEITAKVLDFRESPKDPPLVDRILDKAGQKGTGTWTVKAALDEGIAIPTITAAVDARMLSARKEERVLAASLYPPIQSVKAVKPSAAFLNSLMKALYASKICSYAQGFALMKAASEHYSYALNLSEIGRIWKGGCIIRAVFLDRIRQAYQSQPNLKNLILDPGFQKDLASSLEDWKEVLRFGLDHGIAMPAMSASYAYFASLVTAEGSANLIQAQRDFFGAHTYERTDKPGIFHTTWS